MEKFARRVSVLTKGAIMKKVSWVVPVLWFASTVLLAWFVPGEDALPPELMNSTRGQSNGWCHDDNACSAFALTCGGACTTVGAKCGEERELEHPESCNTAIGNNYCTGQQVVVVCAREWDCICVRGVTTEGGSIPNGCVRLGEGGAGAGAPNGDGSTLKRGTITSDSFNCST